MDWMMKNSNGKDDAMLTIAVVAFVTVTLNLALATLGSLTIPAMIPIFGGMVFTFTEMSAATMTAYLGPTLMAYTARRYTDKVYAADPIEAAEAPPEAQ